MEYLSQRSLLAGLKGSRAADRSNSARVDGRPLTYPRRGTLPGLFTAWNFQFKLEFRAVSLASAKATKSLLPALTGASVSSSAVPKITSVRERYPSSLPAYYRSARVSLLRGLDRMILDFRVHSSTGRAASRLLASAHVGRLVVSRAIVSTREADLCKLDFTFTDRGQPTCACRLRGGLRVYASDFVNDTSCSFQSARDFQFAVDTWALVPISSVSFIFL